MPQTAKFYKFKCTECPEKFEKLMWTIDGEQQGVKCPSCDTLLKYNKDTADVPEQKGQKGPMLNRRENWKKNVPSEFKEWMEGPFAKRHGTDAKINMRD